MRAHSAFWLGQMGQNARPAVPELIGRLKDSNPWVRRASAKALGKIGDRQARPALELALSDENRFVAGTARNALRALPAR